MFPKPKFLYASAIVLTLMLGASAPGLGAPLSAINVTVESCTTCHGPAGVSGGGIPTIAGQDAATLRAALQGYRDGTLTGTIMGKLVTPLSDEEIAAIADYFAAMAGAGQ